MGKGEIALHLKLGDGFPSGSEVAGGILPESGGNAALMWDMHGSSCC